MDSTTLLFHVSIFDTIDEIKQFSIGKATDDQRPFFADKQLEDDRTLSDNNIQKGSTFHCLLRMTGC
jgi:hypothetical protein